MPSYSPVQAEIPFTIRDCVPAVNPLASSQAEIRLRVQSLEDLTASDWAQWRQLRASGTGLRSPFFSPEFIRTAAALRPQVEVAVVEEGDRILGYLPFERSVGNRAVPVAGAFNDAHGLIGSGVDFRRLAGDPLMPEMSFHAWDGPLQGVDDFVLGYTRSYMANLGAHDEGYVAFLERERATILKQRRKTKKMVRDLGPLRLEFDCRSEEVFSRLVTLKREHYQRTNIFDILSVRWAQDLLSGLWYQSEAGCHGVLSALYAGKTLVAVHYGLREGDFLHYWFPTYDPEHHQYSPGTALFLEIARQAGDLGLTQIDMGYGEQAYKPKLTDEIRSMPYGLLSSSPWSRWRAKTKLSASAWIKRVPFKEEIKKSLRMYWPEFGRSKYE